MAAVVDDLRAVNGDGPVGDDDADDHGNAASRAAAATVGLSGSASAALGTSSPAAAAATTTAAAAAGSSRRRFVAWMAEESVKVERMRERLAASQFELARSEASRMNATARWLEVRITSHVTRASV